MQFLYQTDLLGPEQAESLDGFLTRMAVGDGGIGPFARTLVRGVLEQREQIDARIGQVAQNWRMDRMAIVDRNILRICVWELLYGDDAPPKVAINEAIDLVKRFSGENSGPFVNGILDRIKKDAGA